MNPLKFLKSESPGLYRPLRGTDLNDILNVFNALGFGYTGAVADMLTIVSGCKLNGNLLGDGIISYNGVLYVNDSSDSPLRLGSQIYVGVVDTDDTRIYEDGLSHVFSERYVARYTTFPGAFMITDNFTPVIYQAACGNRINDNAIVGRHIAPGVLQSTHYGQNSVLGEDIATNAIATRHLTAGSVTPEKLANGIDGSKIGINTLPGTTIIDSSVTPSKQYYAPFVAILDFDPTSQIPGTISSALSLPGHADYTDITLSGINSTAFGVFLGGTARIYNVTTDLDPSIGTLSFGSLSGSNSFTVKSSIALSQLPNIQLSVFGFD